MSWAGRHRAGAGTATLVGGCEPEVPDDTLGADELSAGTPLDGAELDTAIADVCEAGLEIA